VDKKLQKPWMSAEEIALIERYLTSKMRVLEWGCGGSTTYFGSLVKEYVSVEHDDAWYKRTRKSHLDVHLIPSACEVHVPANLEAYRPGYYRAFRDYIETARAWGRFDAVLIDGRARLFCAIEAIQHLLVPGGYVFFHDFFPRPRYHAFLLWRDPIAALLTGQTLAVFQA
jgi:predicted O-methyltransferase YrrM